MELGLGRIYCIAALLAGCWSLDAAAQVSNDNEYGVNMVDEQAAVEQFVPGELLVKFKEETPVSVKRVRGRFSSTSVANVDDVLAKYGVNKFDKLLPAEEYKPQKARRQAVAPDGRMVTENSLDLLFHLQIASENPDSVMMLVEELKELKEVEYAEPNYYYYISGGPVSMPAPIFSSPLRAADDTDAPSASGDVICANPGQNPLYLQQWGIKALNIDQLWNKPIVNSKRPVIAILDTGVDINHPDLKDNIWSNPREAEGETGYDDDGNGFVDDLHGWDFVYDYPEMYDNNSHGTHVAGIAAACDNALGIVGANPRALIMPVKVMGDDGAGSLATIIKGINYASNQGADVINMSIGGGMSMSMAEALENAYITSVIVAAAGNSGMNIYDGASYPAAYYCVIGVQATIDSQGTLADFSNYDPDGPIFSHKLWDCDVVNDTDPTVIRGINYETKAPGTKILSTVLYGKYAVYNGTSMSCPLVAGAISALKMVKEGLSNDSLMADIAHLDCDFAKVYADDSRNTDMYLAGMVIDDDVDGNKYPDGKIDAGETLHLYPVLLNGWGNSRNVSMHLEVDAEKNPYVKIENPDVDFGYSLGSYGHLRSKNPFIVHISDSLDNDAKIKFFFSFSGENFSRQYVFYETIKKLSKLSGVIAKDTVLSAGIEWYVPSTVMILKGATMTIEPGAHLSFEKKAKLVSFGRLIANGTPENPIQFTGYKGENWGGIESHENEEVVWVGSIYSNEEGTKYTFKKTDDTPIEVKSLSSSKAWYYSAEQTTMQKEFNLIDYMKEAGYGRDFTYMQELLTDPKFLTPIMDRIIGDYNALNKECEKYYSDEKTEDCPYYFSNHLNCISYRPVIYGHPTDIISYCKISNCENLIITMDNCEINSSGPAAHYNTWLKRCNITNSIPVSNMNYKRNIQYTNIVNNRYGMNKYSFFAFSNYFNNSSIYNGMRCMLGIKTSEAVTDYTDYPSYLGTSREDLIRPYIYEVGRGPNTAAYIDISNMPSKPYAEAHGILWKIVVNGKDCQDEFEQLEPLGVGTHKVELYFNRPMNVAKIPEISYGLRRPFSSHVLTGEGVWSEDSLVYSVNLKLAGRESSDGINRFFVRGAEDNEYFECPYDSTRFNFMIQSAGALATGFMAEAKLGRVELKWNNEHNDFTDAMGFNVYRYSVDTAMVADTVRLNQQILPIETAEYTDYEVIPGQTYHYFYRVLSSDLKEYDVSNIVAATPQTSMRGDANGSGDVDVADVITTVNYATGMKPKPFIYEAADMNADETIDIMDIVGIIQTIIHPEVQAASLTDATATYTVENGILYVESPVALAGVQVQLATDRRQKITASENLTGFEHASAWLSDYDWLFLAYNMNGKTLPAGKTAILHIGNARIASVCLSDGMGRNVKAVGRDVTGVERMGSDVMHIEGVYTLSGRKLSGRADALDKLPGGVYIVNGKKVVK